MTVLVIAEHDNKVLSQTTLSVIKAAHQLGQHIDVALFGDNCNNVTKQLSTAEFVNKILYWNHQDFHYPTAEDMVFSLKNILGNYKYILSSTTTFGKNLLPRVAAYLDVEQISDVIAIESLNTFKRPIYAGNAIATVKSTSEINVLTVRATSFAQVNIDANNAPITEQETQDLPKLSAVKKLELSKSDRPELTSARVVVSGGRGLGSKENFKLIEELADYFNGAVGASREAVDSGFISNDHQVGQTGKIVAPDLYFAIGISGAIQHLAGIKDSKTIVAINKDPDAPIFQVADYGIVGDLFEVVPKIMKS